MEASGYRARWPYTSAHASTVIPSQWRKVLAVSYTRERLELPDGDYLDLDWCRATDPRGTAILCHGLEGSSERPYMLGMVKALALDGWSCAAMNLRGCSGEPNRLARSYHSGATEDLAAVVNHVADGESGPIVLLGFSLGGNLMLKYLGEKPDVIPAAVTRAMAISTPVDLADAAGELSRPRNWLYSQRFLRKLRRKIRKKAALMPDEVDPSLLRGIRNLIDFDDRYTGPMHGFDDAADYYRKCSAIGFLKDIRVETLILSARNDLFLGPSCYPDEAVVRSAPVVREYPRHGGHVGFRSSDGSYYSESRARKFFTEVGRG